MSKKLLPCPICGDELKIHGPEGWHPTPHDPDSGGDPYNAVCDCGFQYSNGGYDYAVFVNALNRRTQPDNEPLTLDELRGMHDEPIYIKHLLGEWHWDGWHILESCEEELIMHDGSVLIDENYGKTWIVYRHPLERSEDV